MANPKKVEDNQSANFLEKVAHKIQWEFFRKEGRTKISDQVKVYIISHPKSGRTWLRMLLGKVICDKYHLDEEFILNTVKLTVTAGLPPVNWIHDGSPSWSPGSWTGSRFVKFVTDKSIFKDKKVIFLYRDPKDVLVSSYFHVTRRESTQFKGTLSEFIRSRENGIKKLVTFYNIWYENQNVPEDFLLVRYEDLQENTHEVLKSVLKFIGIQDVEEEIIDNAVDFASFGNMKKMEADKTLKYKIMQPGKEGDEESYKVRKGKVGGYVDYLSQQDIEYIDKVIDKMGCPFYQLR